MNALALADTTKVYTCYLSYNTPDCSIGLALTGTYFWPMHRPSGRFGYFNRGRPIGATDVHLQYVLCNLGIALAGNYFYFK